MKFVFLGIMSDESVASMHATSFEKRKAMAEIVAKAAVLTTGSYDHVEILGEFDLDTAGKAQAAISASYRGLGKE